MKDKNDSSLYTNKKLYDEQIKTLKIFLEKGAITKAQYDKSAGDLKKKMKPD